MSSTKKGVIAKTICWAKHLRPFWKRKQWRRERAAQKKAISNADETP